MLIKALFVLTLSQLTLLRSGRAAPHGATAAWPCGARAPCQKRVQIARCVQNQRVSHPPASQSTCPCSHGQCCALPTWWSWRGGCTRSHSEHGRETPLRRWYFVLRRGRVGRCQVCKAQHKLISSHITNLGTLTGRSRGPFCLLPCKNPQGLSRARAAPAEPQRPRPRGPANLKPGQAPEAQTLSRGGAAR